MPKKNKKIEKFIEALDAKKRPEELNEIVEAIEKVGPKSAESVFKQSLKHKLMAKYKQKTSKPKEAKSGWSIFGMKGLVYGLSMIVLVALAGVITYPLVPAPAVQGYVLKGAAREISYNAPIKVSFSQMMDQGSVEKAFKIEPEIEGAFSWQGNALIFTPKEQFQIGDEYEVAIDEGARSLLQKHMESVYLENYTIVKTPEVTLFTPVDGSTGIPTDAKITAMFDRPIVEFTTLEAASDRFTEFNIQPDVSGRFKWLGTSAVQFIPDQLALATKYEITIPEGLESIDGGSSDQTFVYSFETIRPEFRSIESMEGVSEYIDSSKIKLAFNQKIELDSAAQKIKLYKMTLNDSAGENEERDTIYSRQEEVSINVRYYSANDYKETEKKIARRIDMSSWEAVAEGNNSDEETDIPENLDLNLVVEPQEALERGGRYEIVIENDLKGVEGDLGSVEERSSHLEVLGAFQLERLFGYEKWDSPSIVFTNPVNLRSFNGKISFEPKQKDEEGNDIEPTYSLGDDEEIVISYNYLPSTTYKITVAAGGEDIFGNTLEEEIVHEFTTPALEPALTLKSGTDLTILDGNKEPVFYIQSVNIDYADVKFKRLGQEEFMSVYANGYVDYRVLQSHDESFDRLFQFPLNSNFNQTDYTKFNLNDALGENLADGFYYVTMSNPNVVDYRGVPRQSRVVFGITRNALTVKESQNEVFVWATSLDKGEPVPGLELEIFNRESAYNATTDRNGMVTIQKTSDDGYRGYTVLGRSGEQITAVGSSDWSEGISPWNFNLDFEYNAPTHYMYLYTDRPIYRPGHEVYFKGITRADEDAKFKLPEVAEVAVEVNDSRGNKIHEETYRLSSNGTFNGKLTLGDNIRTGTYRIRAVLNGADGAEWINTFYGTFQVAEYRKPDYKLTLEPEKEAYINQETAKIDVEGAYFFGAPLPNAEVTWTVKSQDYYFSLPEKVLSRYLDAWFSFSEDGYYCYWGCESNSEIVLQGEGKLDQMGNLALEIPLQIGQKKVSQIYTVEVNVTDANNQSVSNRVSFPVHQGEFYLGVRNESYLAKIGEPVKFEVLGIKSDGEAVSGTNVEVSVFERKWNTIKRKNLDGIYYFENDYTDELVETKNVRTGEKGLAEVDFTLNKGGSYKVKVSAKDGSGNEVQAATSFYVSSSDFINWGRDNNDQIELVADKQEYQVGDTARILVKSPYTDVVALVTQERANIMEAEVIRIASNSQTIEIPITEDSLPNIFVSVLIVKGNLYDAGLVEPPAGSNDERDVAVFKVGYVNLQVDTESKRLDISVSPDREKYAPRDEVKLRLKTTDYQDNAVPAEVSISVVDESVLSLTEKVTADLLNLFYRKRFLGVNLGQTLTKAISRINVQVEAGLKGGGGAAPSKRGIFKDTAFFQAVVMTNQDGEVEVSFELPDNLTTWQVLAIGITDDTEVERALVGSNKESFVVTKNVLVRPVLPRFLTRDDRLKVGAIVHNYLDEAEYIEVRMKSNLGDDFQTKYLNIDAESSSKAEWEIEVGDDADEAVFEFSAEIHESGLMEEGEAEIGDIVEMKLPIKEANFPTIVSTSEVITDDTKHIEKVWLPTNLNQKYGSLTISATPSLAGTLNDGLEYLMRFPYGCTEQLSSAILPNLAVKRLIDTGKFGDQISIETIDEHVNKGLQGIYKNQGASGGFGLWANSEASAYITAYALYTLHQAEVSGYTVDQNVKNRALDYLKNHIKNFQLNEKYEYNARAFVLFVLAEIGQGDLALSNSLFEYREQLNLYAKAYLLMAFDKLEAGEDKLEALKTDLVNASIQTARGVSFQESTLDYYHFDTNTRTTALVLQALNRIDRNNPLNSKIVKSLLMERQGGRFATTQETAVATMAMVEYLESSGELEAAYNGTITVNSEVKMDQKFSSENIFEIVETQVGLDQLLADNLDNEIAAFKSGDGKMYFDMTLEYYLPIEELKPLNEGIQVSQEYYTIEDKEELNPVTALQLGKNYKAKLIVMVPADRHYVMVEDFLPAGLEGIDFSLATTQQSLKDLAESEDDSCMSWRCWYNNWYFNHSEVKDDRMMFFADYLPQGVYELEYFVRATSSGNFIDKPVLAQETYFPEVFGRSEARILMISE